MPRIGVLRPVSAADPNTEAFRQGLRDLGYVEGQNIRIDYRFADGQYERLHELAAELAVQPRGMSRPVRQLVCRGRGVALCVAERLQHWQLDDVGRRAVVGAVSAWRMVAPVAAMNASAEAIDRGYSTPVWMTFRQALELGGHVRQGEHGTTVVYADRMVRKETDEAGHDVERAIPFLKAYTVFNVAQIANLPAQCLPQSEPQTGKVELIASAHRSKTSMPR